MICAATTDLERLQRLLGGPELSELRRRLRGRYERGERGDTFTLTGLGAEERRALAGLLGRPIRPTASMRLNRVELDAALARAGLASGLRAALEMLDGPIRDLAGERGAARAAWSRLLTGIREPRLAAEAVGDSHGLDAGRPVATLVLRACGSVEAGTSQASGSNSGTGSDAGGADASTDVSTGAEAGTEVAADAGTGPTAAELDERPREQWARLGVTVNELAMPALFLNLGYAAPGEPVHISLRKLIRSPPIWDVAGRMVFVCENPNIVAIAADSLGPACAPLVCSDGMPGAAQQALLRQLTACGARLRYHGDFDWAGLSIGNFIVRTFGAEPWAFGTADYLSACGGISRERNPHTPLSGERVEAIWDGRLASEMAGCGIAVHEEAVVEALLKDLRT